MRKIGYLVLAVVIAGGIAVAQFTTGLYESFEKPWTNGGTTPDGWTKTYVTGTADWGRKISPLTGQGVPQNAAANQKSAVAWFPSSAVSAGSTTRLESPAFDFSADIRVRVRFFYVNVSGTDTLWLKVSTDGGSNWTTVRGFGTTATSGAWAQGYGNLDSYASGQGNVKIGFEAVADAGTSDIWLDRVIVQYPLVTIREIQEVPLDSLLVADALQNTVPSRYTVQVSPLMNDTVTVVALCVVPKRVITYTASGYTMLLYDTAASASQWSGLFVRSSTTDTAALISEGFFNVERGDIIRMTGIVGEFPSTNMNSSGQLAPLRGSPVEILGSAAVPSPQRLPVSTFYVTANVSSPVRYSTGDQYEGMLVEFTNLTVEAYLGIGGRTSIAFLDTLGNRMSMYDASRYFTIGHTGYPQDPSYILPPLFAKIDTIRGFMTSVSGSYTDRGYYIAPLYPGDMVIGKIFPSISTHRRNPVVVHPDSTPRITVRASKQTGGFGISSVMLHYSLNNGPYVDATMSYQAADTTYLGTIPPQTANTFVHYYVSATDSAANTVILANSGIAEVSSDSSKGFFFYTTLDRPLTIRDLQYTPYTNGRSAYIGATVTVGGVVTADTGHIALNAFSTGGTNSWYIQSGNAPWSGIWVTGPDTALLPLRNGDSVSVSGYVQEDFDVTRILDTVQNSVVVRATGLPEPSPVSLSTSAFGLGVPNGDPGAEAYEGMLVRFSNVTVTDTSQWTFSDPSEYAVADGSGSAILVRRDGVNSYSNFPADTVNGKLILRPGDRISSLTGVMYYSFRRYKFAPRTDADFGTISDVELDRQPGLPVEYRLDQNYPNPFNPATTIQYSLAAPGLVTLKIYNIIGQEVATLVNEVQDQGSRVVRFNGSAFASGVYFYRLQSGTFTQVKKMVMVK